MANDVFANGREVSCKAAGGKSIAAFPDVCFTPPQTPATPPGVPIPYPNTAFAKDTSSGSKTVKISNKETMLKNKSYYKTSTGDEAGSAPKKGIMTSKTKGKAYFTSWSMDVKFEGKNIVRHLDMTTHNHGSPSNTPPWPYADSASPSTGPCKGQPKKCKMTPIVRTSALRARPGIMQFPYTASWHLARAARIWLSAIKCATKGVKNTGRGRPWSSALMAPERKVLMERYTRNSTPWKTVRNTKECGLRSRPKTPR